MGGGDGPPPARIVLESDGKETVPPDLDAPRGAFTAAQAAKEQGVPISTISFGTPDGIVEVDGQSIPVPTDDASLARIADLSGGQAFRAESLGELNRVYSTLDEQIGYQVVRGDASAGWVALGALALALSVGAGILLNRRLPPDARFRWLRTDCRTNSHPGSALRYRSCRAGCSPAVSRD